MPSVRTSSVAVASPQGKAIPSPGRCITRILGIPSPHQTRVGWPATASRQRVAIPFRIASASANGAGFFGGQQPSGETPEQPDSNQPDSPNKLQAVPQAIVYALIAGAALLWWFSSSHAAAGGAMFAAATVAAKPASMFLAAKSAWAGLMAGGLHTLAGPDHLAALTPLSIGRTRTAGALLGALWGAGHSAGQLFLGLLMVLLKDKFHAMVPAIEAWACMLVGMTLIVIGMIGIRETFFSKSGDHHHHHEEEEVAAFAEKAKEMEKAKGSKTLGFAFATFGTGILHGLQPDALFVIIPALALPTKAAAAAYILMFVFGTIAAMGGYTALIGHTMTAISKRDPSLTRNVAVFASSLAILAGLLILLPGIGVEIPWSPF